MSRSSYVDNTNCLIIVIDMLYPGNKAELCKHCKGCKHFHERADPSVARTLANTLATGQNVARRL
jgi:hypothetical protein